MITTKNDNLSFSDMLQAFEERMTSRMDVQFQDLSQRMASKDDLKRFATKDDLKAIEKRLSRVEALLEYHSDSIAKILETLQAQRGNVLQVPKIHNGLQEQQNISKTIQKALRATSLQVHNHERRIELLEAK